MSVSIFCGQEGVESKDDEASAEFTWLPDAVHRAHMSTHACIVGGCTVLLVMPLDSIWTVRSWILGLLLHKIKTEFKKEKENPNSLVFSAEAIIVQEGQTDVFSNCIVPCNMKLVQQNWCTRPCIFNSFKSETFFTYFFFWLPSGAVAPEAATKQKGCCFPALHIPPTSVQGAETGGELTCVQKDEKKDRKGTEERRTEGWEVYCESGVDVDVSLLLMVRLKSQGGQEIRP